MYFPTPNLTNGTWVVLPYMNDVTTNWFAPMLLATIFVIMFVGMMSQRIKVEHAFVSSSFSVTIISYLMILIPGFLSAQIVAVTSLISALSVIFLWKSQ